MFQQHFQEQGEMFVGNFSFKKLNQGLIKLHTKAANGKDKNYIINDSIISVYKEYAEKILLEIFNPNIPFEQKNK